MNDPACFVIGPIGKRNSDIRRRSDAILNSIIEPALADFGYAACRGDQLPEPGSVTKQVVYHIANDDLIIADLTDSNANVFYEFALCHALRKHVIHLIQDGQQAPFDIHDIRRISIHHYDQTIIERAKGEISAQLKYIHNRVNGGSRKLNHPIDIPAQTYLHALQETRRPDSAYGIPWSHLSGRWVGYAEQCVRRGGSRQKPERHSLSANVTGRRASVVGEATIVYADESLQTTPEKNSATLLLTGAFLKDRFLNLQYQNTRYDYHLGEIFVELSADNETLTGKFVGYGLELNEIVSGQIFPEESGNSRAFMTTSQSVVRRSVERLSGPLKSLESTYKNASPLHQIYRNLTWTEI